MSRKWQLESRYNSIICILLQLTSHLYSRNVCQNKINNTKDKTTRDYLHSKLVRYHPSTCILTADMNDKFLEYYRNRCKSFIVNMTRYRRHKEYQKQTMEMKPKFRISSSRKCVFYRVNGRESTFNYSNTWEDILTSPYGNYTPRSKYIVGLPVIFARVRVYFCLSDKKGFRVYLNFSFRDTVRPSWGRKNRK